MTPIPRLELQQVEDELRHLITSYYELNADGIDEFREDPSPLEFMRYVALNRPFVVRGAAAKWRAFSKWSVGYLDDVMQGEETYTWTWAISNADSVVSTQEGHLCFVQPHEIQETFSESIAYIRFQQLGLDKDGPVRYAQTQNDNLRDEYRSLFNDVPSSIDFARIALQRKPDAINFWLGNSRSVTALHKDNYENLFVQLVGTKRFTLLPPVCAPAVNEQHLPYARYVPTDGRGHVANLWNIQLDTPVDTVPVPLWDPDLPDLHATEFSKLVKPIRVTLNSGDMLYLPALWYHKVSQICSAEGISCGVNYWYDMDYNGSLFPLATFATNVCRPPQAIRAT